MHRRLGSAALSQLAFPEEGNPNFAWEKSHWDNTVVKKKKSSYILAVFGSFIWLEVYVCHALRCKFVYYRQHRQGVFRP